MAKRPSPRPISNDTERVLHFEWHAAHFRSVDAFLPDIPDSTNLVYGMPEQDFHTATLRFAILRKFIMHKEPVRLDLVSSAMANLVVGDQPELVENLSELKSNYKTLTRSNMRIGTPERLLEPDELYENIVNGLIIHSDVERRDIFDEVAIGTIHMEAVHQRTLRKIVLSALLTIEEGREQGYLSIPAPYRRVWEPTSNAAS